jgi:hypothetical protein
MTSCADSLGNNQLDQGAVLVGQMITLLLKEKQLPAHRLAVLQECAICLHEFKATRLEYLLLALHTLE